MSLFKKIVGGVPLVPEVVSVVMVDEYAGKVHAVGMISALQCPSLASETRPASR